jgi:transposase
MNTPRRHFTPQEKVAILKRYVLEKTPVSDLCDELGIAPNLFYGWQKAFFENGHVAFDNGRKARAVDDAKDYKIAQLEATLPANPRRLQARQPPHAHRAIIARREHVPATGCHAHTEDQVGMTGVAEQFLAGGRLPQPHGPIEASRQCPAPIGRKGNGMHRVGVSFQAVQLFPRGHVPDLHQPIVASGRETPAIR